MNFCRRLPLILAVAFFFACFSSVGVFAAEKSAPFVFVNPNFGDKADKDALVVISYGATDESVRTEEIGAVAETIRKVYPKLKIVTAFTNKQIIEGLKETGGETYPTPDEALATLSAEGYTRAVLLPLSLIPDGGFDRAKKVFEDNKEKFGAIALSLPLMYDKELEDEADDITVTLNAISGQFPRQQKKEAIVLAARGTSHKSGEYYALMENRLTEGGYTDVHVCTEKNRPDFKDISAKLKKRKIKSAVLVPLTLTAGSHANRHIIGDNGDTPKTKLKDFGLSVKVYDKGLLANAAVRNLFLRRADEGLRAVKESGKSK